MSEETTALLRSIDASLKALVALEAVAVAGTAPASASPTAGAPPTVRAATEYELSGPYGDPEVKMKDPRDWTGPSQQGKKFSECPPEYLDMVAARLEYFALKSAETNELANNGKPKADYQALDARRARGHAARIRGGYVAPARATTTATATDPSFGTDPADNTDDDTPPPPF